MANIRIGNTIHMDTVGAVPGGANLKILHVMFHSNAAGDAVVFKETSAGGEKTRFSTGTAKHTEHFRFESSPMVFSEGIYVSSISSGASVTFITSQAAGGK